MLRAIILFLLVSVCYAADEIYIITLQVKDSSFSLSISRHIKNKMNAVEFDIQTTKEYYDSCKIGDQLASDFKNGSFLFHGSIKSTKVTVLNKRVVVPEK